MPVNECIQKCVNSCMTGDGNSVTMQWDIMFKQIGHEGVNIILLLNSGTGKYLATTIAWSRL